MSGCAVEVVPPSRPVPPDEVLPSVVRRVIGPLVILVGIGFVWFGLATAIALRSTPVFVGAAAAAWLVAVGVWFATNGYRLLVPRLDGEPIFGSGRRLAFALLFGLATGALLIAACNHHSFALGLRAALLGVMTIAGARRMARS